MRIYSLAFACLVALAGCGGETVAPVSGKVTLDGKPLANAVVTFTPDAARGNPGPGSHGTTDESGQFTLTLLTSNVKGAVLGKHKVSISKTESDEIDSANPKPRVDLVPAEYNRHSKLTFEVSSAGSASANFELNTAPPMPK